MVCWGGNVDWPGPWFGPPSALRSDRRRQSRQSHQVVRRSRYISLLLDLPSTDESSPRQTSYLLAPTNDLLDPFADAGLLHPARGSDPPAAERGA